MARFGFHHVEEGMATLRSRGFEPKLIFFGPDAFERMKGDPRMDTSSEPMNIRGLDVAAVYMTEQAENLGVMFGHDDGGNVDCVMIGPDNEPYRHESQD